MLDGGRQLVGICLGPVGGVLVAEARLRLRDVPQRGIHFHVIHEQRHVVSGGNVVDAQAAISQLAQL